jgi:flagellar biosynthesis protein FliR
MVPAAIVSWVIVYWIIQSPRERAWAEMTLALPMLAVDLLLPIAAGLIHRSRKVAAIALFLFALILGLAVSMEMILFVIGGGLPKA